VKRPEMSVLMARQPFWRESQRPGTMEMGRERQVVAHASVSDFCMKMMAVISSDEKICLVHSEKWPCI
jgi:hypothetical protein